MRAFLATIATVAAAVVLLLLTASGASARPSYVALGDSYASGNGTGVYYASEPACYRSPDAYPAKVAAAEKYSLSFDACSGATTENVEASQLGDLSRSTSLVTIEIGGNDAGFVTILQTCLLHRSECSGAIAESDSFIRHGLTGALDKAYTAVRRAAPRAKVLVVGYPRLFTAAGASCGFEPLPSTYERSLNGTADLLDDTIAQAAAHYRFTFVDPRSAFTSHELCSKSPWIQNLKLPLQESYHPTIAGEAAYAELIERSLRGSVR